MAEWNSRANSVFLSALEITDPEQRRSFLASACARDEGLRRAVEGLLQAHAEAGSAFDPSMGVPEPATHAPIGTRAATGIEKAGSIIAGRYKLLQQIGEGGMGTVWMAEQSEPVKRMVALKVIKAGMDSAQVVSRFEAERQALALMDHPNIARVLDGGSTASGRPFFVMELVKGVAITRFCDERRLSPRERLALFVPVCQAVQHAHQKGIIHRDLKPSNVLIALYDGKPVPKVIDFGVAKAAGQKLTEKTLFTGFGAILGTLEYMSPEQAELNQLDIDTRSDIYSLGVLMYELLTGSTPLDKERLKQGAFLELLRLIREEEPPRPSNRLSSSAGLATLSEQRSLSPASLSRLLRGELDWIVMKALEKDRKQRYETATGLAEDIERYLRDEPVHAGPPSRSYQLRKFLKRNRTGVLAASLIFVALLGGVIGTTTAMVRAQDAETRAHDSANKAKLEEDRAKKLLEDVKLHDEVLQSLLLKNPLTDLKDEKLPLTFKQEGPDLLITATALISVAPHALLTRAVVRDQDNVDLFYLVYQNSDSLVRAQLDIEVIWRLPNQTRDGKTFHVHRHIFFPNTAELKMLIPQLQKLVRK
jgi:serine/threonine protein kinase